MNIFFHLVLLLQLVCCMGVYAEFSVLDYGADAKGESDSTAAFQTALDTAKDANGGTVFAPVGRYRFDGTLNIPNNVTLKGEFHYAPSHPGLRDKGGELPEFGTVLEAYAGKGDEAGTAFIRLNANSTLQGVTIHYPEQEPNADAPVLYPWCVQMRGNNPAIIDVQLLNPYNGIDATQNQRALIRNVHGQPIHIGLDVDQIYDIGRIENVHWNPWWSLNTPIFKWQMENGIGFRFARTDWHYVLNTFCFGYNIGYHFTASEKGACNGNFLGIGADNCQTSVLIEETAPMGVLITNGEFVSFEGSDPTMIRVTADHSGTVRFSNCAFWGPCNRNAVVEGYGTVGFSDCTFMQWGYRKGEGEGADKDAPSLDVKSGSVIIRGCEFMEDKPQIKLGENVERAIVTGNLINGETRIEKKTHGNVVIEDNVDTPDRRGWKHHLENSEKPHGFRHKVREQ